MRKWRREPKKDTANSGSGNTPATGEKVKLKFTFWGSPQEKKAVEDAIKAFEAKNPNVTIDSIHIPGTDFLQKLNAMIAGNEAPDLSYSAAWKLKMGEEGLIYNFFDLMKDDPSIKKEDYLQYAWWNWDTDKKCGTLSGFGSSISDVQCRSVQRGGG
ncbi:extracellular solute-binding protein [Paenibacillus rhizoplanae]